MSFRIRSAMAILAVCAVACKKTENRIVVSQEVACQERPEINAQVIQTFAEYTVLKTLRSNGSRSSSESGESWYQVPDYNCYALGDNLALFELAANGSSDLATLTGWWLHVNALFVKNDATEWCEEVTQEFCQKGPQYLAEHFRIWREQTLNFVKSELGGDPRNAHLAFKNEKLSIAGADYRNGFSLGIKLENGRYRINEN